MQPNPGGFPGFPRLLYVADCGVMRVSTFSPGRPVDSPDGFLTAEIPYSPIGIKGITIKPEYDDFPGDYLSSAWNRKILIRSLGIPI